MDDGGLKDIWRRFSGDVETGGNWNWPRGAKHHHTTMFGRYLGIGRALSRVLFWQDVEYGRILVAPCSVGPQALDIAMDFAVVRGETLARPKKLDVFAVDIDATAVTLARGNIYEPRHVGVPHGATEQFVLDKGGGFIGIHPDIHQMVRFEDPAPLADYVPSDGLGFDVTVCTNLFLYLGADARKKTVDRLCDLTREMVLISRGFSPEEREHVFELFGEREFLPLARDKTKQVFQKAGAELSDLIAFVPRDKVASYSLIP